MSRSHVKCKGRYDGCLGTAHRGAVLDLCTNCRVKRQAEMEAAGLDFHGRHKLPAKKLDAVLDEISPRAPDLMRELHHTKIGVKAENVLADAETAGHGILTPEERFKYAVATADMTTKENALAYLEMYRGSPKGTILIGDANLIPYSTRVEIRGLHNTEAATREELLDTFSLTDECLDKVLAEQDAEPQKELAVVTEPTQEARNRTVEHMEKMRQARAEKAAEKRAALAAEREELERLRALEVQVALNGQVHEPPPTGVLWRVTLLQPVVVIEAPTMTAAIAEARERYHVTDEQVIGIVRE